MSDVSSNDSGAGMDAGDPPSRKWQQQLAYYDRAAEVMTSAGRDPSLLMAATVTARQALREADLLHERWGDECYRRNGYATETMRLEAQLAEAREQNRVLTARRDELAGERDAYRVELDRFPYIVEDCGSRPMPVARVICCDSGTEEEPAYEIAAMLADNYDPDVQLRDGRHGSIVKVFPGLIRQHDAPNPARCSDEDCRAPLRDGKTNHAAGCRAEQDGSEVNIWTDAETAALDRMQDEVTG